MSSYMKIHTMQWQIHVFWFNTCLHFSVNKCDNIITYSEKYVNTRDKL